MAAVATSTPAVTPSPSSAHPGSTATRGFTYAYVATVETGSCSRSDTKAV
jgi:hypothetical protein